MRGRAGGGAEAPRDLSIEGRELGGVHFAMDFLTQQNKRVAGDDELEQVELAVSAGQQPQFVGCAK